MKQVNHAEIVTRLKRAEGHLRSIIEMFEKPRSCAALVQQLHAVENAVANAKKQLIHDHLEHCLSEDVANGALDARGTLAELQSLMKYL